MNRKKLFFIVPWRRGTTEGFFCLKNGLEYTPHEPEHEAALFFKKRPREGGSCERLRDSPGNWFE